MHVCNLPMLNWMKSGDHLLTTKETLNVEVDKDHAFRELDGAGVTSSLIVSTSEVVSGVPSVDPQELYFVKYVCRHLGELLHIFLEMGCGGFCFFIFFLYIHFSLG